jgi:hypothetical protein
MQPALAGTATPGGDDGSLSWPAREVIWSPDGRPGARGTF